MIKPEDKSDQEARVALLDFYSSQVRHWGTILLSITVAFFAILSKDVSEFLASYMLFDASLFQLSVTFLAGQAIYALLRVLWYGRFCSNVLLASPKPPSVSKKQQATPYIYRLDQGIVDIIDGDSFGKTLHRTVNFKGWLVYTFASLVAGFVLSSIWVWVAKMPSDC